MGNFDYDDSSSEEPREKKSRAGYHEHAQRLAAPYDWIWIGDRDAARSKDFFISESIRYVVNCTPGKADGGLANFFEKRGSLPSPGHTVEYLRLPMQDNASENLLKWLDEPVEFLGRAQAREDGDVLVHCNQGVSRSVSVVCAFLMQCELQNSSKSGDGAGRGRSRSPKRGSESGRSPRSRSRSRSPRRDGASAKKIRSFAEALRFCQEARTEAEPNSGFCEQLRQYETRLTGKPARADEHHSPAANAGPGPSIGPNIGVSIGPSIGPNIGPPIGPKIGPDIGPSIGPQIPKE